MVPTRGEPTPAPLLVTPSSENRVRISPDGRWIAYTSNESGVFDVFVTRFPQPGQKWPVSIAGGQLPTWRRDGRELFYLAPDGSLMAVPIVLRDDEVDVAAYAAAITSLDRLSDAVAGTAGTRVTPPADHSAPQS